MKTPLKVLLVIVPFLYSSLLIASECVTSRNCPNIDWSFIGKSNATESNAIAAQCKKTNNIQKWADYLVKEHEKGFSSVVRIPVNYLNITEGGYIPSNFSSGSESPILIAPSGNNQWMNDDVKKCQTCNEQAHDCIFKENREAEDCQSIREECCNIGWIVEGYFTGSTKQKCECNDVSCECGKNGQEDTVYEFYLLRSKPMEKNNNENSFKLMLAGGSAKPNGTTITSGPPWGVFVANFFMNDPNAMSKAEALRTKLTNLGYKDVNIVDSRTIPTLWCCFHIVMIGRSENEADARVLGKKLTSQGIKDIMVKKLY